MQFLYTPLVLVGVLMAITLVLILIDKLLGGGGDKMITINQETQIPVMGDDSLLSTLSNEGIHLPSACGGKATCGACKFRLIDGGDNELLPTEVPLLSKEEQENGVRLSCQVKVRGDMKIEIPPGLLSAKEYKTIVEYMEDLTYDTKLVRYRLQNGQTIDFKPGQYAQIKVPGIEITRAYSMASNPKDNTVIEMIIRQVPNGQATTYVHKALEVGDKATLTGPFGHFFLSDTDKEMICIAGGSGKAPIRSILSVLKDRGMPRKVKYFFGAKTTKDLYMTEEFMKLQEEFPNFTYIPALSEPTPDENWTGEVGLITDVVDRLVGDLSDAEAYLCGSPGMIAACTKVLKKHDIQDANVFFDKFS
jgi:Na+-transporting NADH:ubiquinone oxidoreductase subunit F